MVDLPDTAALGAAAALQSRIAIVAELADAHGSGPCTGNGVGVRVPSMAPEILQRHGGERVRPLEAEPCIAGAP
jgi:hypothetical protein